jgi:hypothetical protein
LGEKKRAAKEVGKHHWGSLKAMLSLSQADLQHIQAAQGWLELGNYLEANEELDNVTAALRAHPDVLELRYNVFALGDKWDGCLAIAETLTDQLPQRLFGWLALASAELSRSAIHSCHTRTCPKWPRSW